MDQQQTEIELTHEQVLALFAWVPPAGPCACRNASITAQMVEQDRRDPVSAWAS